VAQAAADGGGEAGAVQFVVGIERVLVVEVIHPSRNETSG